MPANTLFQKLRHLEVRIAEQGRNTHNRSHHLSIEGTTAIANQEVRLLTVNQSANKTDSLFRVYRQIRRDDICFTLESLFQFNSWYALATGMPSSGSQSRNSPTFLWVSVLLTWLWPWPTSYANGAFSSSNMDPTVCCHPLNVTSPPNNLLVRLTSS